MGETAAKNGYAGDSLKAIHRAIESDRQRIKDARVNGTTFLTLKTEHPDEPDSFLREMSIPFDTEL